MQLIDLHMHSTYSDGTDSPAELVELAIEKDLVAMALTDHDTVEGVAEAQAAAEGRHIEVIPGVEISCEYVIPPKSGILGRDDKSHRICTLGQIENPNDISISVQKGAITPKRKEIHILGYGMDTKDPELLRLLKFACDERDNRNKKMAKNFEEAGYDMITYDKLKERFGNVTITRPHFARLLMEAGVIPSIDSAFSEGGLLSNKSPLYVYRRYLTPEQGIKAITNAGGKAVLAHPMMYKMSVSEIHQMLETLIGFGLTGIEAIYSRNKGTDEAFIRKLAHDYDLFITGGTDYHGRNKPDLEIGWGEGNLRVPAMLLSHIR